MDDDVSDKPLSAGMEATRDVIDAYKTSIKEKRNMESWTEGWGPREEEEEAEERREDVR